MRNVDNVRESMRRVWRHITATKPLDAPEVLAGLERHEPPYTVTGWLVAPKFGAAASGGFEYERLPEAHTTAGTAPDTTLGAAATGRRAA